VKSSFPNQIFIFIFKKTISSGRTTVSSHMKVKSSFHITTFTFTLFFFFNVCCCFILFFQNFHFSIFLVWISTVGLNVLFSTAPFLLNLSSSASFVIAFICTKPCCSTTNPATFDDPRLKFPSSPPIGPPCSARSAMTSSPGQKVKLSFGKTTSLFTWIKTGLIYSDFVFWKNNIWNRLDEDDFIFNVYDLILFYTKKIR